MIPVLLIFYFHIHLIVHFHLILFRLNLFQLNLHLLFLKYFSTLYILKNLLIHLSYQYFKLILNNFYFPPLLILKKHLRLQMFFIITFIFMILIFKLVFMTNLNQSFHYFHNILHLQKIQFQNNLNNSKNPFNTI